ncbi:MFS transporter [uncultured Cedecea sp.]|uniref:MFS transporter n=1 Tax=uncultured Cedecea sp. TaxID=988762 RepID=UPI002604A1F9|nr:MFS transporter [uncultured Cedecea sp.]
MNYRARVTLVYLLGFFIDLVNMFIANVAYPDIARRFDATVSEVAWISNSYILGLTLVIPLSSWLAKRIGAKRLFIFSLLIFIAGTCGVGASSSISQLIAWRWIQGVGGGLLIPVGQTMTYALYQSHERARLSSVVMLIALLAPALSPTVGGFLVDSLSWRWVFLASLPLAVFTLILAGLWLKTDVQEGKRERLDLLGLISGCTALTLILLGLTYLGEPRHLFHGALILTAGIFCLAGYIWHALKKNNPLLNLRPVRDPLLHISMVIYQFVPGVFTGVSMLSMLYLQNQLDLRASVVGAMMLPWSLASFAAIAITGKKFNIWGPRPLFITGCLVNACGIGLLALTGHSMDVIICVLAFTLMGFGSSLCSSATQSSAFIQIADSELADASALWNINRQLSFCLGITLLNLLFNLIANTGLPPEQAYPLCFILAACSAVIPVLYSYRLNNQRVISLINQEQK